MRRPAFTLIELVLTIALLGILAAFIYPNFKPEIQRRSLIESADRLRSMVLMCRARAMQDGVKYRISFPGTPDPLDPHAEDRIDVPFETLQPNVEVQQDPLGNPDWFGGFEAGWKDINVMQEGSRCVAVRPNRDPCELSGDVPVAGPSVTEGLAEFIPLTLNPDGTCNNQELIAFTLTDLSPDHEVTRGDIGHIINVMVDGRTGEVWLQRAFLNDECEMMKEENAPQVLHVDLLDTEQLTKENFLYLYSR